MDNREGETALYLLGFSLLPEGKQCSIYNIWKNDAVRRDKGVVWDHVITLNDLRDPG